MNPPFRTESSCSQGPYEAWHENLEVDSHADAPWHGLVREHLSAERDIAGKNILEIGCGRGGLACWLAAFHAAPVRVVAIDFASSAIRKAQGFARERGISSIDWEIGDIQAIAHHGSSFDTVISCETIEHVPYPKRALVELARVLKPGGRLFLTTPNYLGPLGMYRIYLRLCGRRYTEVGQPINNFTLLPVTRRWVEQSGLIVTAVDAVGHYLPLPGRPPVRFWFPDRARRATRWFGLHSLIVAVKP